MQIRNVWLLAATAALGCLAALPLLHHAPHARALAGQAHERRGEAHGRDAMRAHDEQGQRERDHDDESPATQAFWQWRVSYPTGRFAPAWYDAALAQHARMAKGLPASLHAKELDGVLDPAQVRALGPRPLADADYGLVAGRVNAIVVHPTQPNIVWIGVDGGGVWKSSNCCGADTTWQVKTDAPQIANIAIGALAIDPHDANTLYAGTGDFQRNRPFAFGASGLLKSSDGGESWQVLATDVFDPVYTQPSGDFPQRRSVSAIAVDPLASRNVVAGTNQGVYFSFDAGAHWQGPCFSNAFATQRQDITSLLLVADGASTEVVVAVGGSSRASDLREDEGENGANGIYRTTLPASGCPATWTLLSRADNGWPAGSGSGIPASAGGNLLQRLDLALAPAHSNILYAQAMGFGVWRSDDGGANWVQTATLPDSFASGCRDDSFGNGYGFEDYNAGLTVSPTDPDTVLLSSTDLWRSTDGAHTFVDLTCAYDYLASGAPGHVHPDEHARAFVGAGANSLLIGNDGGIYASANALAPVPDFVALNGGANTIEFYSGDLTAAFDDAAGGARGIVGAAQDNGLGVNVWDAGTTPDIASWKEVFGGDGCFARIEPMLQQRWYYGTQYGYINASVSGPFGKVEVEIDPEDPATGVSWQGDRIGFLAPFELYKFGDEKSCPAAAGCQRMLAGTFRVWESLSGGIPSASWYANSPDLTKALSTDGNLSVINKTTFAYSDPSVAVSGSNDGAVWIGFDLGGGAANPASWVDLSAGNAVLPNRPVMDVRTDPHTPTTVYAALAGFDQNTPATPGHVYKATCDTRCAHFSWADKSGNLPNIPVNAILINPNVAKQAFAGTDWGLYFTDDIDATPPQWQRFGAGLPSAMIWDLVVDRGATTLAIFTRSRGAYVWPLPRTAALTAGATASGHVTNPRPQIRPPPAERKP